MSTSDGPQLYPGEVLEHVADAPCLYKYIPADKGKPLIVLIPGGAHTARIFYGGHTGHDPDDFLASWLVKAGFGVLAISYPIQGEPELIPATAPTFRIHQWGLQAAEVTRAVVDANGLGGDVVLVGWSMGGRLLVPYSKHARGLALKVKLFVSLAASPGLHGIRPFPPGMRSTPAGYAYFSKMLELFTAQIHDQERINGGKVIIPDNIYRQEYYGHTPVSLLGWPLKSDGKSGFLDDPWGSVEDPDAHNVGGLSWMASLSPTSPLDARHALSDKATWAFLLTQKLTLDFEKRSHASPTDSSRWQEIMSFVDSAPVRLSASILGNHYFFLGRTGAEATAKTIVQYVDTAKALDAQWSNLLED